MTVYPAILTESLSEVQAQINQVINNPSITTVQIDIIDGQFADNLTITPADLPSINFGDLSIDLHLMVDEPLNFVYECIEHRESLPIRGIIGQVERMSHQLDFVETVHKNGWKAGLSFDLFTPLTELETDIWDSLDIIQLMAIEAGFQGQVLNPSIMPKIKTISQIIQAHQASVEILIDGGVKHDNVAMLQKAGAQGIVVGSEIWQSGDTNMAVKQLLVA